MEITGYFESIPPSTLITILSLILSLIVVVIAMITLAY